MRVLVIEDFEVLATAIGAGLRREGMAVDVVLDGNDALEHLAFTRYDVVVLDRDLPGVHGDEVCRQIVAGGSQSRVLMLTASSTVRERVDGLGLGADDYLPKPFDLSLLLARINALLRRRDWFRKDLNKSDSVFNIGNKTIDFETQELRSEEETVPLTLMETELLRYLIDHDGKIVSRSAILEEVWGLREDTDTRAIDNFIVRLRKYLEDEPSRPRHLLTVRGVGYRFVS